MNEYTFYVFLITYCLVGMIGIPLAIGFLLRKTHLCNGIAAMISMVLAIPSLLLSPGILVNNYFDMAIKFLWLVFASWTLILSIFGIIYDKHKVIPIVAISTLAGILIMITLLV